MTEQSKRFYLGLNQERRRVYADVRIEDEGTRIVEFVDHTEAPCPANVAISFEIPAAEMYGQISADERVIVEPTRHTRLIERAWETQHLNTMNAACMHMTDEMLARREGESAHDWQTRMLDTVACPVTGYRWGRAWLARTADLDILNQLRAALAED
jgi:hypothetical protein